MAQIIIYRSGSPVLTVLIDNGSQLRKQLNGSDSINLSFILDSFTEILIGDYITWMGQTYRIYKAPEFKKASEVKYEYSLIFEGPQYALLNPIVFLDSNSDFYLTGLASDFIDLMVTNLNRVYGSGIYSAGTIPVTEYKNLQFTNENCLVFLQRICDEFELEFYISGTTINLSSAIGNATGLTFQYHDGLRNIRRVKVNDKNIITRVYPFGSDRNIDYSYGAKRLKISTGYVSKNTSTYGIIEAVKVFDDIYPHFEGVVDVSPDEFRILDSSIDFDLNSYGIEGETAKIVFLTGDLAGYEFEITDFEYVSKIVTFKTYTSPDGLTLPSATIKAAAGDKFTFVDIKMPAAYITAAEAELLSAANDYLDEVADPNVIYEIEMDWHALKTSLISLEVGDLITIEDTQLAPLGVDLRILELSQSLANEYKYTVKVGQNILINYFQKIQSNQDRIELTVSEVKENSFKQTRRALQYAQELQDLIYDPDGYFDTGNIKPLSIEAGMITVGMKSSQFMLKDIEFNHSAGGVNTIASWTAGTLIHFTVDYAGVKTWNIALGSVTGLTAATSYYIFAKCSKINSTGSIIITTTQYLSDPGDGYYYFLIGILHGAISGERAISLTYGSTNIAGRFIKTGKISSFNGATYFDLDNNQIVMNGGSAGGFTVDTEKLSFSASNKNLYLNNAVKTSGYYGRGLTIYDSAANYLNGDISLVRVGQISPYILASNANYFTAVEDYGFEIIKAVGPGYYSHLMRVGKNSAILAGWNFDHESIFSGTKTTGDGYSAGSGSMTIKKDGSIHAQRFYINADGSIGFSSSLSGQRIVINSTDNNIKFYKAGQTLECLIIDDNVYGSLPGMRLINGVSGSVGSYYESTYSNNGVNCNRVDLGASEKTTMQGYCGANGILVMRKIYENPIGTVVYDTFFEVSPDSSLLIKMKNLPTTAGGAGLERVYLVGNYLHYG